jgi:alpha-tubulin suppressor-like RCC1 family protein
MPASRAFLVISALVWTLSGCREDTPSPAEPMSPVSTAADAGPLTFRQVSAGGGHSCAVTTGDQAYCWGVGSSGQLGIGWDAGLPVCDGLPCSTRPAAVVGGLRFRTLTTGTSHTCGVTIDDRAFCWGSNSWGQIGDGHGERTLRNLAPTAVVGGLAFRQLAAGHGHTCGRTIANRVYCWGLNIDGQLGDGTTTDRLTPVPVAGNRQFSQLTVGLQHTCGITPAGEAFCWGWNHSAQLGDSSTARFRKRPVRVAGGHEFRQIDAGSLHTCAVTPAGRAFCWGSGHSGAIGDGNTLPRYWPRAVRSKLDFDRVTAGDDFTCAEASDNSAWCWGLNEFGQLGGGTAARVSLTPVAVAGGHAFTQVDAASSGRHACANTSTGAAYCWGWNLYGQLGDGTRSDRATPAAVVGPA